MAIMRYPPPSKLWLLLVNSEWGTMYTLSYTAQCCFLWMNGLEKVQRWLVSCFWLIRWQALWLAHEWSVSGWSYRSSDLQCLLPFTDQLLGWRWTEIYWTKAIGVYVCVCVVTGHTQHASKQACWIWPLAQLLFIIIQSKVIKLTFIK